MKFKQLVLTLTLSSLTQPAQALPSLIGLSHRTLQSISALASYITPTSMLLGNYMQQKTLQNPGFELAREFKGTYNYKGEYQPDRSDRCLLRKFVDARLEANGIKTETMRVLIIPHNGVVGVYGNIIIISYLAQVQLGDALCLLEKPYQADYPEKNPTQEQKEIARKIVLAYEVIFDHEIGHIKHKDTFLKTFCISAFSALASHYLINKAIQQVNFLQNNTTNPSWKSLLSLPGIAFAKLLTQNWIETFISRRIEARADAYAYSVQKNPEALIAFAEFWEKEKYLDPIREREKFNRERGYNETSRSKIGRCLFKFFSTIFGSTHPSNASRAKKAREAAAKLLEEQAQKQPAPAA